MTRKFLQELDLSGETIDKIMSAHGEGIERQKALYKELQKELESVKEPQDMDEAEDADEPQERIIALDEFVGFHQFAAVEIGAYIGDVRDMFGEPYSTHTRQQSPRTEITTKTWREMDFFSSLIVIFSNGYAYGIQSVLENYANISAEEFNQISIGMSELEVFEILGAPNSVFLQEVV